jgi:alkylhydroperoxidase/carboxymuconolactone decarboxylase family protein YurZ
MSQTPESRRARSEELIAQLKAMRGFMHPEWEYTARENPELMEVYNAFVGWVTRPDDSEVPPALPLKFREMVMLPVLAFRGEEKLVVVHIRKAMQLGATPQEIREVFETIILPAGAVAWVTGIRALLAVLAEQGGATSRQEGKV